MDSKQDLLRVPGEKSGKGHRNRSLILESGADLVFHLG